MASVELRGFPLWTDAEDLKYVIGDSGHLPESLTLEGGKAVARFAAAAEAGAAAVKLNGFEFTPGYPLSVKAVADPLPTSSSPGHQQKAATGSPSAKGGKGAVRNDGGKGGAGQTPADDSAASLNTEYPVADCVGAGRIEGWFLTPKSQAESRGWGHVQSFSFEGNLLFRMQYSPLIADTDEEYKQQDPVTFEVVKAPDGRHLAVRLALPDQDVPEMEEGVPPWDDPVQYDLDVFLTENKKWLTGDAADVLRAMGPVDQQRVISAGHLAGCRDPVALMHARVRKAKELLGEVAPSRRRQHGGWTAEEWRQWNDGAWPGPFGGGIDGSEAGGGRPRPTRDLTWGNEDGLGVFFGGLTAEVDESVIRTFAEAVGTVTFVKLFRDVETGEPRGCGKVFFESPDMVERAIQELHKRELCGRPITVELLGDEKRKKRKRPDEQGPQTTGETEEGPKLLPLSYFTPDQTVEQKMDLCFAVFEDLLVSHDPTSNGKGIVWMVRSLIREVNDVLEGSDDAKQAFMWRLRKHPWFGENEQQVKWQQSKRRINISKISPSTPAWRAWQAEQLKQHELPEQPLQQAPHQPLHQQPPGIVLPPAAMAYLQAQQAAAGGPRYNGAAAFGPTSRGNR